MEIFAPAAVGCFRPVALLRGRDALRGFTFEDDPSASAGTSFFFWVILFFFGTNLLVLIDFNSFIEHRPLRKQFLARIWWNQKSR